MDFFLFLSTVMWKEKVSPPVSIACLLAAIRELILLG